MARKKKHEEHVNAEAWAIPYGDLVTLLFALFTVMYAMSSVNEGKFRVLSDSMIAAFHGAPKSMQPINVGQKQPGKGGNKELVGVTPTALMKIRQQKGAAAEGAGPKAADGDKADASGKEGPGQGGAGLDLPGALARMQHQIQQALQTLIDSKLVSVRRESLWLEIEINTDILFPSGASEFTSIAVPVLDKLAEVLKPFPNPIRVEGHTDDRPIHTPAYPSNWELSAARAASVVHQFTQQGVDPLRLEIVGYGEFRPKEPNGTSEGRNANRRVAVLVLEQAAAGAAAAGGEAADSTHSANGLPSEAAAADRTVLVKDQPPAGESAAPQKRQLQPPAQHIGPVDLVWPGSSSEVKAPPPAHHE